MKIAHLADIHIRVMTRHEEYREVFSRLYSDLKKNKPDLIVVAGDIVHSKLTMSPELIVMVSEFFINLRKISDVVVMPGNHDVNVSNSDRMDALSPIIDLVNDAANYSESIVNSIIYYDKTGVYSYGDKIDFYVWSQIDRKTPPLEKMNGSKINIGLFHGPVDGSELDGNYRIRSTVGISIFSGLDFVMLGDIHKGPQFFADRRINFPGSLIQQNNSESLEKGYLLWDIDSKKDFTVEFREIKNDYGFYTINAENDILPDIELPQKCNLRVVWPIVSNEVISKALVSDLLNRATEKYNVANVQIAFKPFYSKLDSDTIETSDDGINFLKLGDANFRHDILRQWILLKMGDGVSPEVVERVLSIDDSLTEKYSKVDFVSESVGKKWRIESLELSNFMSYGDKVTIDFSSLSGLVGLFGNNACGKSVIFDSILFALFNKTTRNVKNEDLVNKVLKSNSCYVSLIISIDDKLFSIKRDVKISRDKDGEISSSKTSVKFLTSMQGSTEWENLNLESRVDTEKVIREYFGTYDDFILTAMMSQGTNSEFIGLSPAGRTDNIIKFLGLDILSQKFDDGKSTLKALEMKNNVNSIEKTVIEKSALIESISKDLEKLKELEVEKNGVDSNISLHQSTISELRSKIDDSITYTISEKEDANRELVAEITKKNEMAESIDRITLGISDDVAKISALEDFMVDEVVLSSYTTIAATRKSVDSNLSKIGVEISYITKEIKDLEKEIAIFSGCPVYDDPRHSSCTLLKGFSSNAIEKLAAKKTQLHDLNLNRNKILEDISVIEDADKKIKEQSDIKAKIESLGLGIQSKKKDINTLLANIETKTMCISMINSKIQTLNENQDKILKNSEYAISIAEEMKLLGFEKMKLRDIENKILELHRNIAVFKSNVEILERRIEDIEKDKFEIDAFSIYCSAMHRKGIPSMIIDKLVPYVNYELNQLLSSIVDFSVNFKVTYDPTSVDIMMEYGSSLSDGRSATMASGMEKFIINMAIRVVLLKITSLPVCSTHFIDEGFGTLDSDNILTAGRMLNLMKSHFDSIVMVTHLDVMKDSVDSIISVAKENNTSKLYVS